LVAASIIPIQGLIETARAALLEQTRVVTQEHFLKILPNAFESIYYYENRCLNLPNEFSNGNNREALRHYHSGFLYIKGSLKSGDSDQNPFTSMAQSASSNVSPELLSDAAQLEKMMRLNMAAVLIKLNKPERVIDECSFILACDQTLVKAYFRRGLAYLKLKEYWKAKADFETVIEMEPDNQGAIQKMALIKKWEKKQDKKSKQAYQKMFSGTGNEGNQPSTLEEVDD